MSPTIIQMMLGVGIGLIAALFVTYKAIENTSQNRNKPKKCQTFFAQPGKTCSICLETMNAIDMQYLICGHALHTNCWKEVMKHEKKCPECRANL